MWVPVELRMPAVQCGCLVHKTWLSVVSQSSGSTKVNDGVSSGADTSTWDEERGMGPEVSEDHVVIDLEKVPLMASESGRSDSTKSTRSRDSNSNTNEDTNTT